MVRTSALNPTIVLQIDALASQRLSRWIDLGLLPGFKSLREQSCIDSTGPIQVSAVLESADQPAASRARTPRTLLLADLLGPLIPGPNRVPTGGLALAWQALAGHEASLVWSRQLIADLQGWRRFRLDWPSGDKPVARLRLRAADTLTGFVPIARQQGESFQSARATLLTYQTYDQIVQAAQKLADRHAADLLITSTAKSESRLQWFRRTGAAESNRIAA